MRGFSCGVFRFLFIFCCGIVLASWFEKIQTEAKPVLDSFACALVYVMMRAVEEEKYLKR